MNKSDVLAVGVLLVALGLYLQTTYNIEGHQIGEYLKKMNASQFTLLVTALFWAGLIIVIISIAIRPKKKRIVIPEAVEAPQRAVGEAAYGAEEAVEAGEAGVEQAYEELPPSSEEAPEETLEEEAPEEEEEKSKKLGEVIGFCPRCGAPVTEGMRYCRKCGLKLK